MFQNLIEIPSQPPPVTLVRVDLSQMGVYAAYKLGALADDVAATIHAHPSLGEAVMEASLATFGKAIHVP